MYSKQMIFGRNDYLEVSSRIVADGERLMLSLRARKDDNAITISSVILSEKEVDELITHLQGWLDSDEKFS